jgi:lipoprotein-anchoring transpeptidase ErfK/SrfK
VEKDTKKTPRVKKPERQQITKAKVPLWHQIFLATIFSLSVFAIATALFLSVAHGSLAKIYVGSVSIKANSSQKNIEKQIAFAANNYKLVLQKPDGSKKTYSLSSVGVSVDAKNSAANAKKAISESLPQRLQWWKPMRLKLVTRIDENAFQTFISTQATEVKLAAKNATLAISSGKLVLTPETQGDGSQVVNSRAEVPNAVAILSSKPLLLSASKLQPLITSKDLQASQAKVQAVLGQQVVFNVADKTVTASAADITSWLELSPVEKDKTVDVTVNSGRVSEYINKIARPYIQPPRSRLITQTNEGYVVLDQGANGIDVVNKDQTATQVAQQLLQGKGAKIDLSIKYAVAQTVEVQPYDKWLVVDVTTKRMYAYEQTNLVRTFLVSAGAPNTPTVLGKFAIYAKYGAQDMRGNNADGSRYFQPDVPYVNYFYNDYAVHGNYWRPSNYFGNINSSHGCVGTSVSDGAWIYDWAPIGTPVIVHT